MRDQQSLFIAKIFHRSFFLQNPSFPSLFPFPTLSSLIIASTTHPPRFSFFSAFLFRLQISILSIRSATPISPKPSATHPWRLAQEDPVSWVSPSLFFLYLIYALFIFHLFFFQFFLLGHRIFPLPLLAVDLERSLFAFLYAQFVIICLFLGFSACVLSEEFWIVGFAFLPCNLFCFSCSVKDSFGCFLFLWSC